MTLGWATMAAATLSASGETTRVRELGLQGFDDLWPEHYRLAFVRPSGTDPE